MSAPDGGMDGRTGFVISDTQALAIVEWSEHYSAAIRHGYASANWDDCRAAESRAAELLTQLAGPLRQALSRRAGD